MIKKLFTGISALVLALCCTGILSCDKADTSSSEKDNSDGEPTENRFEGKTLVVYYSFTGNSEKIAKEIHSKVESDILEIKPAEEGIDYAADGYAAGDALIKKIVDNPNSASSYPAIKEVKIDASDYGCVVVVEPLWWSHMAAPMQSFLFKYGKDFKGKKIALACSSHSSGISGVSSDLKRLVPAGDHMGEDLWVNNSSRSKMKDLVEEWVKKKFK
ncbi:MAG: flavodoxin [Bacteroidales bacterium]|nr:flavodoxin [Bacteroidales bacterium]